ncbi:hypothetical protein K9K77_03165 [Candidatus Babeliales bacterium]|nr:hypothetical protein [Candidatus Babeliales bacterium]
MHKNSLNLFIKLISFDQSLVKTKKEIKELTDSLDACNKELHQLSLSLETSIHNVRNLKKEVDAKELEMKLLDEQEKAGKERLASVSSDKEYQALKREVEGYKKKQHEYEDGLVSTWGAYECAQKELESLEKKYTDEKEEIERVILHKQERLDELNKVVESHAKEQSSKQEGIPEEWLTLYKRMSGAVSNPVVEVLRGSCVACFYKIPHQDILSLQNDELLSCKGCYRLLYSKNESVQELEIEEKGSD